MNFLLGVNEIKPKHKKTDSYDGKTTHKSIYSKMLMFQYLFIIVIGFMIYYLVRSDGYYFLLVIVFPIVTVSYNTWVHMTSNKTDAELLQQLNYEIENDQTHQIIPILLVSLGIIMQYMNLKKSKIMFTYMIWAVILGTIIPVLLKQMLFEYTNLNRIIVFSEIEFTLIAIAVGLMLLSMSLLL